MNTTTNRKEDRIEYLYSLLNVTDDKDKKISIKRYYRNH